MFLDDTACNLASLNLLAFRDAKTRQFDVEGYEHAVRLWTVVLEISVLMAQFPSREIAQLSYEFRTLGLGYANIGGLLMSSGIVLRFAMPAAQIARRAHRHHDRRQLRHLGRDGGAARRLPRLQEEPRAHAARDPQPPPRRPWRAHRLREGRDRRRCRSTTRPVPIRAWSSTPSRAWDRALALGEQHGYRNAQVSVIAPTGTIGLVMDCDTTGIEPDFALVKFKKLAGGGYFKIINRAVPEALRVLGYSEAQIAEIEAYAVGHGTLGQAPGINHTTLKAKGFTPEAIEKVEKALPTAFDIKFAFNKWTLGEDFVRHARHRAGEARRPALRPARRARLHQARDRGRQHPRLRRHDGRGRAAPQGRALSGVRLRQPVRAQRQALSLGREPHPHDGGGAAVHLGRDLQDHQHAERRHGRGLQGGLSPLLEARAQGQRALPRRLQALAAAAVAAHRRRGRGRRRHRGLHREAGGGARRGAGGEGGREGGRAHR